MPDQEPTAGLCETCRHRRVVRSRRGSTFTYCMLSERDRRFPKYPMLPVLRCDGYLPDVDQDDRKVD
jgi:hypothetical protein